MPSLVGRDTVQRAAGRGKPDRVHRRAGGRCTHLPLRRHRLLRPDTDRPPISSHGRLAGLHAAAGALGTRPGPRAFSYGRTGRGRGGANRRNAGSQHRGRLPLPRARRRRDRPLSRARTSIRLDRPPAGAGPESRGDDCHRRRSLSNRKGADRVRLVTFEQDGKSKVGVRVDGGVVPLPYTDMASLIRAGDEGLEAAKHAAEVGEPVEGRLLAPVRPQTILASGPNYASHAEENPGATPPTEPFFFSKLPSAVIGPGEAIVIPYPDTQTDWEVELAMVIGR